MSEQYLEGTAAREVLAQVVEEWYRGSASGRSLSDVLFESPHIRVLPPPDPSCVREMAEILASVEGAASSDDWMRDARALHKAGLCSCEATALLLRWENVAHLLPIVEQSIGADTLAYLEARQ